MVKKVFRIYPLYVISLLVVWLVFGFLRVTSVNWQYDLLPGNLIVHLFAMQGIFPAYKLPAMWFVSVLLIYFAIYGILFCTLKDSFHQAISLVLFTIPLAAVGGAWACDPRLLHYFVYFAAGVLAGKWWYSRMGEGATLMRDPGRMIAACSYASFAVYLFHFPILALVAGGLRATGSLSMYSFVVIGFPLVFVAGYYIQRGCDAGIAALQAKVRTTCCQGG